MYENFQCIETIPVYIRIEVKRGSVNMFFDHMMFSVMPVIISIIVVVIFGIAIFGIISSIKQGIKNNHSPLLTVPAKVASKRIQVRGDHSRPTYYVTFEVQSGDRLEFDVDGKEYGMLVEQDLGLLSFKGTRYMSFERQQS